MMAWHQLHITHGPTESSNNLAKRVKRVAFGFRSFANYRIRALLHADKPDWSLLATITPRSASIDPLAGVIYLVVRPRDGVPAVHFPVITGKNDVPASKVVQRVRASSRVDDRVSSKGGLHGIEV
jgi:hypothetical protein